MLYIVCCYIIIIASSLSAAFESPTFQWPNRPQLIAFTFEGSLSNSNESLALLSQFSNGRLACSQVIPATWFASDCTSDLQTLQSNHWEIGAFSDNDPQSQSTIACLLANATVRGLRNGNVNDSSGFQYTMFESPSFMWPFIESNIVHVPFTDPSSIALVEANYQGIRAPIVLSLSAIQGNFGPDVTKVILKQIMSLDEIVAVTTGQLSMLATAKSASEAEAIVNLCRTSPIEQVSATNNTSNSNLNSSAPANMNKTPIPSPSLQQGISPAGPSVSTTVNNPAVAGNETPIPSPSLQQGISPAGPSASTTVNNSAVAGNQTPIPSQSLQQGISPAGPSQSITPNSSSAAGADTTTSKISPVASTDNTSAISSNNTSQLVPNGSQSGVNTSLSQAGVPVTTGDLSSGKNSSDVTVVNATNSVAGINQTGGSSTSGQGPVTGNISVITGKPGTNITGFTPVPTPQPTAANVTASNGFTLAPNIIGQKPPSESVTDPSTGGSGNDSSQSSSSGKSAGYVPYVIGIGGGLCAMAVAIVYKVFKREDRFPPVITSGYVFESEDRGIYDLEACNDSVRAASEESRERSSSYVHSELESVSTKS